MLVDTVQSASPGTAVPDEHLHIDPQGRQFYILYRARIRANTLDSPVSCIFTRSEAPADLKSRPYMPPQPDIWAIDVPVPFKYADEQASYDFVRVSEVWCVKMTDAEVIRLLVDPPVDGKHVVDVAYSPPTRSPLGRDWFVKFDDGLRNIGHAAMAHKPWTDNVVGVICRPIVSQSGTLDGPFRQGEPIAWLRRDLRPTAGVLGIYCSDEDRVSEYMEGRYGTVWDPDWTTDLGNPKRRRGVQL